MNLENQCFAAVRKYDILIEYLVRKHTSLESQTWLDREVTRLNRRKEIIIGLIVPLDNEENQN